MDVESKTTPRTVPVVNSSNDYATFGKCHKQLRNNDLKVFAFVCSRARSRDFGKPDFIFARFPRSWDGPIRISIGLHSQRQSPLMIKLSTILDRIPDLPRPLVWFEGGEGSEGVMTLAWGVSQRFRLDWTTASMGDVDWLDSLPGDRRLVGFVAYELGIPPGAIRNRPPTRQPICDFFEPEYEVQFDAKTGAVVRQSSGAVEVLEASTPPSDTRSRREPVVAPSLVSTSFSQGDFEQAVRKVQDYIAAGDVYQVNLSVAQILETDVDPWTVYLRLREINPSPWMGFADFGDWQIVSGSPELLVEVSENAQGREIRSRPIAGTRKKTGEKSADAAMKAELKLDEKEQAEHLMLVDLARNDIGRVAEYGTLDVSELAVVEEYSHVYHLVSEVRALLAPEVSNPRVFQAIFPCGTITGVPKIRAMEVIAELEPVARGGYTGALGWMGPEGLQFNILIRSALFSDNEVAVQAGAGVVWDSIPEREWFESLRKARAIRLALGLED